MAQTMARDTNGHESPRAGRREDGLGPGQAVHIRSPEGNPAAFIDDEEALYDYLAEL